MFYNKRWAPIPETDKIMVPEKAMRLVQKGGFAYHAHPDIGYPFINQWFTNEEICELTEINVARPTYTAFAVSFNSTFVDMMKVG